MEQDSRSEPEDGEIRDENENEVELDKYPFSTSPSTERLHSNRKHRYRNETRNRKRLHHRRNHRSKLEGSRDSSSSNPKLPYHRPSTTSSSAHDYDYNRQQVVEESGMDLGFQIHVSGKSRQVIRQVALPRNQRKLTKGAKTKDYHPETINENENPTFNSRHCTGQRKGSRRDSYDSTSGSGKHRRNSRASPSRPLSRNSQVSDRKITGDKNQFNSKAVCDSDGNASVVIVQHESRAKTPEIITLDCTDTSDEDKRCARKDANSSKDDKILECTSSSEINSETSNKRKRSAYDDEFVTEVNDLAQVRDIPSSSTLSMNVEHSFSENQTVYCDTNEDNSCDTSMDSDEMEELQLRTMLLTGLVRKIEAGDSSIESSPSTSQTTQSMLDTTIRMEDTKEEEEALREVLLSQMQSVARKRQIALQMAESEELLLLSTQSSVASCYPQTTSSPSTTNMTSDSWDSPRIERTVVFKHGDSNYSKRRPHNKRRARARRKRSVDWQQQQGERNMELLDKNIPSLLEPIKKDTQQLAENDLRMKLIRSRTVNPPPLMQVTNSKFEFPEFGVRDTDLRYDFRPPEMHNNIIRRTVNFTADGSPRATITSKQMMDPISINIPPSEPFIQNGENLTNFNTSPRTVQSHRQYQGAQQHQLPLHTHSRSPVATSTFLSSQMSTNMFPQPLPPSNYNRVSPGQKYDFPPSLTESQYAAGPYGSGASSNPGNTFSNMSPFDTRYKQVLGQPLIVSSVSAYQQNNSTMPIYGEGSAGQYYYQPTTAAPGVNSERITCNVIRSATMLVHERNPKLPVKTPQSSPVNVNSPLSYPVTVKTPQSSPVTAITPQFSPGTVKPPKSSTVTVKIPQSFPGTVETPQFSPGTVKPPKSSTVTVKIPQSFPGTVETPQSTPGTVKPPKSSRVTVKIPQSFPGTVETPQSSPVTAITPQSSPGTVKPPKSSTVTVKIPQSFPGTVETLQSSPGTVKPPKSSTVTVKIPQSSPGTAKHPQPFPVNVKTPQSSPGNVNSPLSYPVTVKTPQSSSVTAITSQFSSVTAKTLQSSPGTVKPPKSSTVTVTSPQSSPGTVKPPTSSTVTVKIPQSSPGTVKTPQSSPGTAKHPQPFPVTVNTPQSSPVTVKSSLSPVAVKTRIVAAPLSPRLTTKSVQKVKNSLSTFGQASLVFSDLTEAKLQKLEQSSSETSQARLVALQSLKLKLLTNSSSLDDPNRLGTTGELANQGKRKHDNSLGNWSPPTKKMTVKPLVIPIRDDDTSSSSDEYVEDEPPLSQLGPEFQEKLNDFLKRARHSTNANEDVSETVTIDTISPSTCKIPKIITQPGDERRVENEICVATSTQPKLPVQPQSIDKSVESTTPSNCVSQAKTLPKEWKDLCAADTNQSEASKTLSDSLSSGKSQMSHGRQSPFLAVTKINEEKSQQEQSSEVVVNSKRIGTLAHATKTTAQKIKNDSVNTGTIATPMKTAPVAGPSQRNPTIDKKEEKGKTSQLINDMANSKVLISRLMDQVARSHEIVKLSTAEKNLINLRQRCLTGIRNIKDTLIQKVAMSKLEYKVQIDIDIAQQKLTDLRTRHALLRQRSNDLNDQVVAKTMRLLPNRAECLKLYKEARIRGKNIYDNYTPPSIYSNEISSSLKELDSINSGQAPQFRIRNKGFLQLTKMQKISAPLISASVKTSTTFSSSLQKDVNAVQAGTSKGGSDNQNTNSNCGMLEEKSKGNGINAEGISNVNNQKPEEISKVIGTKTEDKLKGNKPKKLSTGNSEMKVNIPESNCSKEEEISNGEGPEECSKPDNLVEHEKSNRNHDNSEDRGEDYSDVGAEQPEKSKATTSKQGLSTRDENQETMPGGLEQQFLTRHGSMQSIHGLIDSRIQGSKRNLLLTNDGIRKNRTNQNQYEIMRDYFADPAVGKGILDSSVELCPMWLSEGVCNDPRCNFNHPQSN